MSKKLIELYNKKHADKQTLWECNYVSKFRLVQSLHK